MAYQRILCFLTGDTLGKNLLLPHLGLLNVLGSIGEESSTSSMSMKLDMLELLRKSLLLPL